MSQDYINGITIIDALDYVSDQAHGVGNSTYVTGSVGFDNDTGDVFQFTASGDGYAELNLYNLSDDIDLYLVDGLGTTLGSSTAGGFTSEYIEYFVSAGTTYYVIVDPWSSAQSAYDLFISGPIDDQIPANSTTTYTLSTSNNFYSTIDFNGDQDWVQIYLNAGYEYTFDLLGHSTGNGTLIDPYLRLYDPLSSEISANDDSGVGLNSQITYTTLDSGYYYLSAGGLGGNTGSYTLQASRAAVDSVAGNSSTSARLIEGSSVSGALEHQGDTDWVRIYLESGQQYTFELKGSSTSSGTLTDPLLALYDARSNYLGENNDGGEALNSLLTYTPGTSGFYFLEARSASSGSTGSYTLFAEESEAPPPNPDQIPEDATTGRQLAIGSGISSTIDVAGDRDWIKVYLVSESTYQFELRGASSGTGTLDDPYLNLYDAYSLWITSDDDNGQGYESQLTYTADYTGVHYLSAGAYGSGTGAYYLEAEEIIIEPLWLADDTNSNSRLDWNEGIYLFSTGSYISDSHMQTARLYGAALARNPDVGGFNYWITEHQSGASFEDIASSFYWSSEMQALMDANNSGVVTQSEFVNHMYINVLGRSADQSGFDYWSDRLQTGTSEGLVMAEFVNSEEYVQASTDNIAGFFSDNLSYLYI